MFNLIPESLKEKIKTEYRLRRLILVFIFTLFIQATFLIFLYPSWLISSQKENEMVLQTEKMNQSQLTSNISSTTNFIKSLNAKLSIMDSTFEYPQVVPIVNIILSQKTGSIHIDEFSYTTISNATSTLTLNGISNTRESLVSFVRDLKNSGKFKVVDLPISNLAKNKDISFLINLTVAP